MDPVLIEKLDKLIAKYRKDAQVLLDKGEALNYKKQYTKAIKVYDEVGREYPFLDILKFTNSKKGEIFRKAQLGI